MTLRTAAQWAPLVCILVLAAMLAVAFDNAERLRASHDTLLDVNVELRTALDTQGKALDRAMHALRDAQAQRDRCEAAR